jgi:hypothetical protein
VLLVIVCYKIVSFYVDFRIVLWSQTIKWSSRVFFILYGTLWPDAILDAWLQIVAYTFLIVFAALSISLFFMAFVICAVKTKKIRGIPASFLRPEDISHPKVSL